MKRPSTAGVGLLFAAPAMFGLFLFVIGPTLAVAVMSLTDWQLGASEIGFVGLDNYRALPGDRVFRTALANTLVYAGLVTPISVALGLGLALLIEASPLGRGFFRAAFFLPVVTTTVAMAVVWEFVLHPSLGPANLMLRALGFAPANFLGDAGSVLATLAAIGVWENAGFNMVLFLAGLKAIPRELYQAAAVDGADRAWERFWTITFPLLGPTMLFVAVIALLRSFKVFEIVAAITQGGPRRASEVLLFTIYQEGFSFFRIGHAAALTMVFLCGLLVLALFQIRLLGRRVHYA
ncbi:ABC transporter permease [Allostella sp. ATCC 35155]|nr:ABC transporter permease [Stella sp. ATCC 35155]